MPLGVQLPRRVPQGEGDVERRPAAQQPGRVDELARGERGRVRARTRPRHAPENAAPFSAPAEAPTTRSKQRVRSRRSSAAAMPADTRRACRRPPAPGRPCADPRAHRAPSRRPGARAAAPRRGDRRGRPCTSCNRRAVRRRRMGAGAFRERRAGARPRDLHAGGARRRGEREEVAHGAAVAAERAGEGLGGERRPFGADGRVAVRAAPACRSPAAARAPRSDTPAPRLRARGPARVGDRTRRCRAATSLRRSLWGGRCRPAARAATPRG